MRFIWKPCDIVASSGAGFFSKGIRWMTQGWEEDPTEVSHVAHCIQEGDDDTAILHDALAKGWSGTPREIYAGHGPITVYRPINLTKNQVDIIVEQSKHEQIKLSKRRYDYSYGYIALSALDFLLGDRYLFRRMVATRLPVCSTATARKWRSAGLTFGKDADAIDPDSMHDWMKANTWAYECVRQPTELEKRSEEAAK